MGWKATGATATFSSHRRKVFTDLRDLVGHFERIAWPADRVLTASAVRAPVGWAWTVMGADGRTVAEGTAPSLALVKRFVARVVRQQVRRVESERGIIVRVEGLVASPPEPLQLLA